VFDIFYANFNSSYKERLLKANTDLVSILLNAFVKKLSWLKKVMVLKNMFQILSGDGPESSFYAVCS